LKKFEEVRDLARDGTRARAQAFEDNKRMNELTGEDPVSRPSAGLASAPLHLEDPASVSVYERFSASSNLTEQIVRFPSQSVKNADRPLILLDLDNTLICAEELDVSSSHDTSKRVEKMEKARSMFRTVRMEDYYDIFERPHIQEFLDYLFKHFNVGVWTASSKDYAIFVIKNFILVPDRPLRKLELFLCSHHCNLSKKYFKGVPKDLKLLSDRWGLKDLADVFLVDDLEHLAEHQPHNVIHVKPFFYDSSINDRELLDVIPRIHTQVFK
jgi:TFIIF-interacting CTD phosphatase-like protein